MKLYILLLAIITIFSCGSSTQEPVKIVDKSVSRPVRTLKSKGNIIMYQNGRHDILSFKLRKDEGNSILKITTQFGFEAATVYVKSDSVWVFIPSEKVVYFQDKSNVLLVPTLKTDDIPIGMIMDYLAANFSFKYSRIHDGSDLELMQSIKEIKYGYLDGDLAKVEYIFGKSKMNTSISHVGSNVKLNIKRNQNLLMTVNIDKLVLQADMPDSIFLPKIPKKYQYIIL